MAVPFPVSFVFRPGRASPDPIRRPTRVRDTGRTPTRCREGSGSVRQLRFSQAPFTPPDRLASARGANQISTGIFSEKHLFSSVFFNYEFFRRFRSNAPNMTISHLS